MLTQLRRTLRIYMKLQVLHIRTHMEYRLDFGIGVLAAFIQHFAGFVFIWSLFTAIPEIEGWSLWEMGFLYGLLVIPRGLVEVLFEGTWRLRYLVNTGEFDRLLLRPISLALQVLTQASSMHGWGTICLGFSMLIYASGKLNLTWSVGEYFYLLLTLVSSSILIASINFITNCIGFWEPSASSAFPFLIINTAEFAKFPVILYSSVFQFIFTWILPFSFISYYPGILLLDRSEASWISYIAPLPAVATLLFARLIWTLSLRRYQSTGH